MSLGGGEIMWIVIIALLVFGPSQIPKLAKGMGQAIKEFKRAQREITDEIEREPAPKSENKPIQ
jgi:sec-independent protein translocase protein TatA